MRSKTNNYKVFIILLFIFWACLFIVILSVSLPYNAIGKPFIKKSYVIKLLAPEGWSFFTKNPREERLYFLVMINGKLVQDPRIRNATLKNIFGLKRDGRIVNLIYSLKASGKNLKWYKYTNKSSSQINYCASRYVTNKVLIDSVPKILLYNDIVVLKKKIVPWAYNNFEGRIDDEILFTKLDVEYK